MHYFSEGCAGQYINCKNFLNLCLHVNDFGVKCEWTSPCDGIGGTVKRGKFDKFDNGSPSVTQGKEICHVIMS